MVIPKHLTRYKRWIVLFLLFLMVCLGSIAAFNGMTSVSRVKLEPPNRPIPETLFGMHIHQIVKPPSNDSPLTPWPAISFGAWRFWDTYTSWPNLEPQPGQWNFDTLDRYLDLAAKHQIEPMLLLGLCPRWASARPTDPSAYGPGLAAEPKNIDDWRNYVRTVATRYKGRIHYYELWNEPNLINLFYTGTMEKMLELSEEAYRILKEVDPSITVVSPSAAHSGNSGLSWLAEYVSRGGGFYADVIGYHFAVRPEPPEAMLEVINQVKEILSDRGLSEKPLWNTETSWKFPNPFPSDDLAAAYVARAYILQWAAGLERFYWYAWDNKKVGLQMTQADRTTITPAAVAYANVQKWLVGAQMTRCESDRRNTWICQLKRDDGYRAGIVWNPDRQLAFNLPEDWQVQQIRDLAGVQRDFSGNSIEIGPSPLLLENFAS